MTRRLRAASLALVLSASTALSTAPAWAQRAAGVRPAASSVEGGLWAMSDKAEEKAKASAELNKDPALAAYVREVGCKVAAEYCSDIRVYVMDRPFFNAAMAPNGYMEVWSGVLLRAADEAELAFVLGHETTHFAHDHSVERWHATKNRLAGGMILSAALTVAGAAAAVNAPSVSSAQSIMDATRSLVDIVYLGTIASIFGFSRAQEMESDQHGLRRAAQAGYDVSAGVEVWQSLLDETGKSDFPKVRKSETRPSIFLSHPLGPERLAALEKQRATLKSAGETGRERHRAAIRPHLAAWLKDDLRRRDFGQTLHLIDRLAAGGEDLGVLYYYKGQALRVRNQGSDLVRAGAAYATASEHPDAPVAVWRELGDVRRKLNDAAGAQSAYETYLAKAPTAEDAWLVQDALNSLKGS